MFTYNPLWSIEPKAAQMIEAGLPKIIAQMDAARLKMEPPSLLSVSGDTAIIDIQGIMLKRESIWTMLGFAVSTASVSTALSAAVDDKSVRSIILNIDSPGGTVDGMYQLADSIRGADARKPVFSQVSGEAASAAYWAAASARKIYANQGDLVGSIGVRMMTYDFSRAFANAGIEAVPIDTGEFKSAGAEGTEITDRQREYFQSLVDDAFADFKAAVATGRNNRVAKEASDGRLFTARQALEIGLIDGIQDMGATLKSARRMTGRSADAVKVRERLRAIAGS